MRHSIIKAILCCLLAILGCITKPEETAVVRLGYLQNDLHHLPAFVALELGLFDQEGIEVRVGGVFRAGPEEMSAFGAGELDLGYVGQAPATAAFLNGVADIVFIAQVNMEGSALVVKKTLGSLRGASLAIPGHATMQDMLLRKVLDREGLSFNDIKPIVLKPPEMIQALELSNIDGFIAWEPYPVQAEKRGAGRIWLRSNEVWKEHPCCVMVVSASLYKQKPELVLKILVAHQKACDFISNNNRKAVDIGMKYTGMDRQTVAEAIGHIKYTTALDREKALEFIDFLKRLRYINPRGRERTPEAMFGHP